MKVLGVCLLAVLASAMLTQGAVAPDWAVKKSQDDKAGAEKAAAEKEVAEAVMQGAAAGGVAGAGADAGLCWPVVKEDSYSGAKNSFGVMEPAPGSFGSFRAGQKAKKKGEKDKPDRCHSGIDLYTGSFSKKKLSKGRVVAIDDGVVKNIYEFKQCNDGWVANSEKKTPKETPTYAIFVYHPNLKTTINYGEASVVYVAKGEPVKKGQIISQNTACEMLHIEKYASPSEDKAVTANKQWIRPDGMKGNCAEDAKFFKANFPKQKPLEDPRPFIKSLADNANKGCPAPDDSHLEDKTHLVAGGGAKKKKEDGDKKKGGEKKKGGDKKPNKKKKKFMFL